MCVCVFACLYVCIINLFFQADEIGTGNGDKMVNNDKNCTSVSCEGSVEEDGMNCGQLILQC